jgi:hypothetical protein
MLKMAILKEKVIVVSFLKFRKIYYNKDLHRVGMVIQAYHPSYLGRGE